MEIYCRKISIKDTYSMRKPATIAIQRSCRCIWEQEPVPNIIRQWNQPCHCSNLCKAQWTKFVEYQSFGWLGHLKIIDDKKGKVRLKKKAILVSRYPFIYHIIMFCWKFKCKSEVSVMLLKVSSSYTISNIQHNLNIY